MKEITMFAQKMYEEFLTWDFTCPVLCGNCCIGCPKLTENGCSLERKFRPWQCNAYLCEEGYNEFLRRAFPQN